MSKLKDRGNRKKRTVKIGTKGKVIKTKKTLEELNKNVTGAKRAREKEKQEAAVKERKRQAAKKVNKLATKKPKTISVKTKERTVVKMKPPVKKVVKKKKES